MKKILLILVMFIYSCAGVNPSILNPVNDPLSKKLHKLQGKNKIWFCGAWTGFGFHEDGIKSAAEIANSFNIQLPWMYSDEELHAAQ